MKYQPIYLETENQLNRVLRQQRKSRSDLGVLFVSTWDKHSMQLVERFMEACQHEEKSKPLYIVDSFTMPHAFVIYKTTKLPHLVQFKRGSFHSEDYLSQVYKELGLS